MITTSFFRSCCTLLLLLVSCCSMAQDSIPLSFSYSKTRTGDGEVLLKIKAVLQPGTMLYSVDKVSDDAPASSITFDSSVAARLNGPIAETGRLHTSRDSILNTDVKFYADSVVWQQKMKAAAADSFLVKGVVSYMYRKGEDYVPGEAAFRVFVQPETPGSAETGGVAGRSLWWIFFTALAGGFLALLTPCVYSMIPVTVSFFTKRSRNRAEGIRNALYYSISIILIFTILGFLITLIFGPAALNNLATNWVANLVFFAVFLIFGISFLGAFDIALPSSWSNVADTNAGTQNFIGIFFMALTLVLVSFSCTGPIIGNLLVLAAKGNYYGPLVGMLGFSVALALPFAFFALFPGMLNVLGKAGGWLNAVKVTLGFLELALALKFLSNADLSEGWRLLDREVFISMWVVIFVLLGLYLLGKIRFHHDDELPKNDYGLPFISIPRLLFAIAAFAFAVYMVPGLWGAPLKGISAFVPPMGTQDFNASAARIEPAAGTPATRQPQPVKYAAQMKMYEPEVVTKYGMVIYYDYDEALAAARLLHKPLMIDFTGINCVNCRKMEGQVWSDPGVMNRLKEDFVIVSLYVDMKKIDLQENEQYFSPALNKQVVTLADKSTDRQVSVFRANSQPYYFFLDGKENKLAADGYGYDPDINKFIAHLDQVKEAYAKSN